MHLYIGNNVENVMNVGDKISNRFNELMVRQIECRAVARRYDVDEVDLGGVRI